MPASVADADDARRYEEEFGAEHLLKIARAGIELEALKQTPIFTLIMQSAAVEARRAMEALIEADASDTYRIMELQHTIRRHRDMEQWLMAAVEHGLNAARELERREHGED